MLFSSTILNRQTWTHYFRLIRVGQTFFALPFVLMAAVEILTSTPSSFFPSFSILLLIKIIGCFILLRASAMSFNRLVDRSYDKKNPRTKNRELPRKLLTLPQVTFPTIVTSIAFLLLATSINWTCLVGGVLLLTLTLFYSYTKRWTVACHFFLGLCIGFAPIAVWIAMLETVSWVAVFWTITCMGYITGFDLIYAMFDQKFDRAAGLHSFPARFGTRKSLQTASVCFAIALFFYLWSGLLLQLHFVFFVLILGLVFPLILLEIRIGEKIIKRAQEKETGGQPALAHPEKKLGLVHIAIGQGIFIAYTMGRFFLVEF